MKCILILFGFGFATKSAHKHEIDQTSLVSDEAIKVKSYLKFIMN